VGQPVFLRFAADDVEEANDGLDPAIEIRNVEFLVGRVQVVVGQAEAHMTLGIFSTSWKSVTIGIEPPERMNTVSFLKTSCMASVAALMNLLSVPTTHAGPLLQILIFVSMPLGVSFFT